MSDQPLDDLARRLEALPREAWERPVPPAAPWPAEHEQRKAVRGRRLQLRPLVAAGACFALIAAGLAAGLVLSGEDGEPAAPAGNLQRVDLRPVGGQGRGAAGTAKLSSRAGEPTVLRVSGLGPSSGNDFYELWLLGDGGKLVSLGSFRVTESGEARIETPLPVDPARFRYLDVSREPADGDPGHSAVSVLRGPIT